MAWPSWSIYDNKGLARYVLDEMGERVELDGITREDEIKKGNRLVVVRAIYQALLKQDFHYARERYAGEDDRQIIRYPGEMLTSGGNNATCLDLALLFAGVCLGHELLPLVVIVEEHAFVAVSLLDDPREPVTLGRILRDGDWVNEGVLLDRDRFGDLIEKGYYVPVECTGFAKTETLPNYVPEGRGRKNGTLGFDDAVAAARSQSSERRFRFAVDPTVLQRAKGVAVYRHVAADHPFFDVVDQAFLQKQRGQQRKQFTIRPPQWADVVHGEDSEVMFVERDQTQALQCEIVERLIEPLKRGTDRRLHTLFIVGPPGAGKSTIVRRAAALLVDDGRVIVADAGISSGDPSEGELDAHHDELVRLSSKSDRPVLLLLDDPLGSSWIALLRRLARHRTEIAVLAASPEFLYKQFHSSLPGENSCYRMQPPSTRELQALARFHHYEGEFSARNGFFVSRIEAGAHQSFDEFIRKLWVTLNNSQIFDQGHAFFRVPWPVRAFYVVCFFSS